MSTVTARDITAAMRELHPAPVRLSVAAASSPGWFKLRLPSGSGCNYQGIGGTRWLEGYLGRRLDARVVVLFGRAIRRRDYGRDVEYSIRVRPPV